MKAIVAKSGSEAKDAGAFILDEGALVTTRQKTMTGLTRKYPGNAH